ncbi:winged helix-turn-helix domain-containing protein [Streptomyces sp. ISL-86]|uniref:winged helix-turn-helix domain-containing protein n=1 Tax=Streptomyces sp. ISL-86 TaxID=2819187 RepID=UPI001BE62329|nr:winged helix-turn-helix domain-containing protein [Streptomyces sp. ISL-86]MBT2458725.1 winged helix-turn-helix transcriptional regulator [Streptomyces sp. ISL-86]
MPSPSRGGGPAVMPKYQRIAAALRHELDRTAHTPGGKLPSERTLAARYQVNRQTVRAALQHLREDGLVVTGRRGTRPVASASPAARPAAPAQSRLAFVTVPPSLAALLRMSGGQRTLVHHHRELGPAGETLRQAVTYICPRVVAETPDLAGYRDRPGGSDGDRDEDPGPLRRWLDGAALDGRVAETMTMTMTRTSPPAAAAASPACGLSVRRTVHDRSGRLLAVTDLAFPTWDRLTIHRDRESAGFRVT